MLPLFNKLRRAAAPRRTDGRRFALKSRVPAQTREPSAEYAPPSSRPAGAKQHLLYHRFTGITRLSGDKSPGEHPKKGGGFWRAGGESGRKRGIQKLYQQAAVRRLARKSFGWQGRKARKSWRISSFPDAVQAKDFPSRYVPMPVGAASQALRSFRTPMVSMGRA